jgi:hypothetical protein
MAYYAPPRVSVLGCGCAQRANANVGTRYNTGQVDVCVHRQAVSDSAIWLSPTGGTVCRGGGGRVSASQCVNLLWHYVVLEVQEEQGSGCIL